MKLYDNKYVIEVTLIWELLRQTPIIWPISLRIPYSPFDVYIYTTKYMIAWFSRWFYYSFVIGASIFGMLLCIFVLTKSVYLGGVYFYLVSWWSNRYNIPSGHLFLMLFSQYYYWSSTSFTFSQLYYCFWYGNVYFVVLYIFLILC